MNRIIVSSWEGHELIEEFEDNCVFDFSMEKVTEITQIILESGLSLMIKPNMGEDKNTLLIYIDKGRFGNRKI